MEISCIDLSSMVKPSLLELALVHAARNRNWLLRESKEESRYPYATCLVGTRGPVARTFVFGGSFYRALEVTILTEQEVKCFYLKSQPFHSTTALGKTRVEAFISDVHKYLSNRNR